MLSLLLGGGKARLWDTCMEDISMVHLQNNITHVLWSHSGNFFTSMDDKGKIVIWANKVHTPLPPESIELSKESQIVNLKDGNFCILIIFS